MSVAQRADYEERVYAGVLGKIIGVYLGRPFEGWSMARIESELGEIRGYVHEWLGVPLVVPDDDISGTFTFLRALEDHGAGRDLTSGQVGETWLNYIVEDRAILWWGGMGNSTEHTAYLRLRGGIPAPRSGSAALNTRVVAEQIGAQIFSDGWGMVAPGDPWLAADLAERAARVSHDGEAVYGARVVAAMEALAFIERDLGRLHEAALNLIPPDCVIARVIRDVRAWHAQDGDWRRTRERIEREYGPGRYGGHVHVVPNHALIHLALLYGGDSFGRAMTVVNTAGWDTDCNAGNVGCLLGIKNGLAGLSGGDDWRGPVADRLYLPSADGGRAVTDALTEAGHVVNMGRALAGLEPRRPGGGARFHFSQPGSVQGFGAGDGAALAVENGDGGALTLTAPHLTPGEAARALTPTFLPPEMLGQVGGYGLPASPSLHPGQTLRARLRADAGNVAEVSACLCLNAYGPDDTLRPVSGPAVTLGRGEARDLVWRVPDPGGPIAGVGVELRAARPGPASVRLEYLTWDGAPEVVLARPAGSGTAWRRAWVDAVDLWGAGWPEAYRLIQNRGRGLLIQGGRGWAEYGVSARLIPHLGVTGLAARVQGLRHYDALLLVPGGARLVRMRGRETVLAETPLDWTFGEAHDLRLEVAGPHLQAFVDGVLLMDARDTDAGFGNGGVALVVEEGMLTCDAVDIGPLPPAGEVGREAAGER